MSVVAFADYPAAWGAGLRSPGINYTPVSLEAEHFNAMGESEILFGRFSMATRKQLEEAGRKGVKRAKRAAKEAGELLKTAGKAAAVAGVTAAATVAVKRLVRAKRRAEGEPLIPGVTE